MENLSSAEQQAVEQHRERLAREWGRDVTFEEALADWGAHHAARWRAERHAKLLEAERHEILKHKWIESEKARRDLGQAAALDWIRKYAAQWRKWYDGDIR